MKKIKLEYELNSDFIKTLSEDDDVSIVSLYLLHLGTNRNMTNISKDCVIKSMHSFFDKPIICLLNESELFATDFTEHAETSVDKIKMRVAGVIPESANAEFVDSNGFTYLKMDGIIYKLYAEKICEILQRRGGNVKVSIEILPIDAYQDEQTGVIYINEFKFMGVCLLGEGIEEGIMGSHLEVEKFTLKDCNNKYIKFANKYVIPDSVKKTALYGIDYKNKSGFNGINSDVSFAEMLTTNTHIDSDKLSSMKKYFSAFDKEPDNTDSRYIGWMLHGGKEAFNWVMKNIDFIAKDELGSKGAISIDKSEKSISDDAWDDKGIRKECLEASNWKEVCKAVFLSLEDGWEEGKESALKYPVMQKKGNKVVYNRKALASAKAYAVKFKDDAVLKSLKAIYKKLNLVWDDKSNNNYKGVNNSMDDVKEQGVIDVGMNNGAVDVDHDMDVDVDRDNGKDVDIDVDEDNDTDYKAKFEEMESKFKTACESLKKYERKDEEEKMCGYIDKFKKCFTDEEYKSFKDDIEKCTYEEFAKKVDDHVKDYVLKDTCGDVEKECGDPSAFSVSPFTYQPKEFSFVKGDKSSLDSIIKDSKVKLPE